MNEIKRDGITYDPSRTYWVAGARSAWDTVVIGLYVSKEAVDKDYPPSLHGHRSVSREANQKEINQFFKLGEYAENFKP
jgi:hypothetical protein